MMTPSCKFCKFRVPDTRPEYSDHGHCRRMPPQIIVYQHVHSGPTIEQHWPWMNPGDWCGEFRVDMI